MSAYCKDCEHYELDNNKRNEIRSRRWWHMAMPSPFEPSEHVCMAKRSLVTGQRFARDCYEMRRPMGECDTDAKLFKRIDK